jgi:predicted nucleic acid-binding protein
MSMMSEVLLLDSGVWIATADARDRWEASSRELVFGRRKTTGALDLTLYEVANTVGAKWLQDADATELCRSVERRCARRLVRMNGDLIRTTVEIAVEYRLTSYDAAYVAVARRHDWTLVSTDIRDLVSKGLAITPDAAV